MREFRAEGELHQIVRRHDRSEVQVRDEGEPHPCGKVGEGRDPLFQNVQACPGQAGSLVIRQSSGGELSDGYDLRKTADCVNAP